jgi:hypothetical protein
VAAELLLGSLLVSVTGLPLMLLHLLGKLGGILATLLRTRSHDVSPLSVHVQRSVPYAVIMTGIYNHKS